VQTIKRLYLLLLFGIVMSGLTISIFGSEGAAITSTVEELPQVKKVQEASDALRSGIKLGILTGFSCGVTDSLLRDPLAIIFTWFAAGNVRDSYIENNFHNNIHAKKVGYSAGSLASWATYAITLCIMNVVF
jgi:hypothetical protein